MRIAQHLFTDHWSVRRAFPRKTLKAIEQVIAEGETRHDGELRFAVEAMLPIPELIRGTSPRERAIEVFSRLRVWDTAHNSGVLIYVLLADRHVEIVADRGIDAHIGKQGWQAICDRMQAAYRERQFEEGSVAGVRAISELLAAHFPASPGKSNELPNRPVVL
jgi:uncharacterized membrane protein